jgi:hypothetical protein
MAANANDVMAAAITHLKLFSDGGSRQVALFSGADQATDWQRNCDADAVLSGGWHLLPKEELLSLDAVELQGFLRPEALAPEQAEAADPLLSWQLRTANLYNRLADAAAAAGDHSAEARACEAVAGVMDDLNDPTRQGAWLLRAVQARLAQWHQVNDPAAAVALAELFGQLAQRPWPGEPEAPAKGGANQRFWLGQALERQAELSLQAEANGDLHGAASAAGAVVLLQQQLAALPALSPA